MYWLDTIIYILLMVKVSESQHLFFECCGKHDNVFFILFQVVLPC